MPASRSAQKIAYALVCHDVEHSGVFRKVRDQVTQWRALGHFVQLFIISDKESTSQWRELDPNCVLVFDGNIIRKILNRLRLVEYALGASPSIVYLRDSFPIRIPRARVPTVIEVQTYVEQELRLRSRLRSLVFKLFKKHIYRHVKGAVFVTHELMELNEFRFHPNTPKISIGNGIDLSQIRTLPPPCNFIPAIFFVGSPNQPWHGVSELVEFASKNPEIQVEIVGISGEATFPNIRFHGMLNPKDYRAIAARCVAGIGTLNLSAKGMREASPLKVREYLALGLPVITKYRDTDLNPSAAFVLELPNDGRVLSDFSFEIRTFLDYWSSERVARSQIGNLDIRLKEEMRLKFLDGVIQRNDPGTI